MATDTVEMLSFDEARARILDGARRVSTERVTLNDAIGRVLAEDIIARHPLPRFDHSAMDGYAIATEDLEGSGPWTLAVVGESRAGRDAPWLVRNTACRIFTGAPLPARADAIVMQEHVIRVQQVVRFEQGPTAGQFVRRAGDDLSADGVAIAAGTRMTPGALALTAMLETHEVVVARRPRVTIVCSGDELRGVGSVGAPTSIPESNSVALRALALQCGADVRIAPIVRDYAHATTRAIEDALEGTDLLLTVGGVSVGDHDVVRPALERAGVTIDFWRVAIKPGKPLVVGHTDGARVLGLPGNPASAIVTFTLFGIPLLRAMQRDAHPTPLPIRARLGQARKRAAERLEFVRGKLQLDGGQLTVRAFDNQASGAATSLAASDGLALIPAGDGMIEAGTWVDFVRWSDA